MSVNMMSGGSSGLQHRFNTYHDGGSVESFMTGHTGINSIYLPRRVESFMGEEDRKKYELAQASQYNQFVGKSKQFAIPQTGQVYEFSDAELEQRGWADVNSASESGPAAGAGTTTHRDRDRDRGRQPGHQTRASDDSSRGSASSRATSPGPHTGLLSPGAGDTTQRPPRQGPHHHHHHHHHNQSHHHHSQSQSQSQALGVPGQGQRVRSGRSPLGRQSWVPGSPGAADEVEMEPLESDRNTTPSWPSTPGQGNSPQMRPR